jgi:hypothetical protein
MERQVPVIPVRNPTSRRDGHPAWKIRATTIVDSVALEISCRSEIYLARVDGLSLINIDQT